MSRLAHTGRGAAIPVASFISDVGHEVLMSLLPSFLTMTLAPRRLRSG
jgi:hypothetical protein